MELARRKAAEAAVGEARAGVAVEWEATSPVPAPAANVSVPIAESAHPIRWETPAITGNALNAEQRW